jgi:hypothetical protein
LGSAKVLAQNLAQALRRQRQAAIFQQHDDQTMGRVHSQRSRPGWHLLKKYAQEEGYIDTFL